MKGLKLQVPVELTWKLNTKEQKPKPFAPIFFISKGQMFIGFYEKVKYPHDNTLYERFYISVNYDLKTLKRMKGESFEDSKVEYWAEMPQKPKYSLR